MLLHLYLHWPIDPYRLIFNKCQIWIRAPPEATIFKKGRAVKPAFCERRGEWNGGVLSAGVLGTMAGGMREGLSPWRH